MKTIFNNKGGSQKGLIKWILIIIVALIIAGYYGFDIKKAVEAPTTQSNLTYVQQVVSNVWFNYLKKPVTYLWKDIFLDLIWGPAQVNLKRVANNEPTTLHEVAPQIPPPTTVK